MHVRKPTEPPSLARAKPPRSESRVGRNKSRRITSLGASDYRVMRIHLFKILSLYCCHGRLAHFILRVFFFFLVISVAKRTGKKINTRKHPANHFRERLVVVLTFSNGHAVYVLATLTENVFWKNKNKKTLSLFQDDFFKSVDSCCSAIF